MPKSQNADSSPSLHDYNLTAENPIGVAYIIMDYTDGLPADELQLQTGSASLVFGTAEQDEKFRKQMAAIQIQLSQCRFDQIGSLRYDERSSEFSIGPEPITGKGPWKSSPGYFNDVAGHELKSALVYSDFNPQDRQRASLALPTVFKELMSTSCIDGNGPFSLTRRDFCAHNVLVNDEFEIIPVIDFDAVLAAPIELAAQFPRLVRLDRPPPGDVPEAPLMREYVQETLPKLRLYQAMLLDEVIRLGTAEDHGNSIGRVILSEGAAIVFGLESYRAHQDWINNRWMGFYLECLARKYGATVKPVEDIQIDAEDHDGHPSS